MGSSTYVWHFVACTRNELEVRIPVVILEEIGVLQLVWIPARIPFTLPRFAVQHDGFTSARTGTEGIAVGPQS